MYKIIYIIKSIIDRKKEATTAIVIQLVIGMSVLCLAGATYYNYYVIEQFFSKSGISKLYYFEFKDKFSNCQRDSNTMKLFKQKLKKVSKKGIIINDLESLEILPNEINTYEKYVNSNKEIKIGGQDVDIKVYNQKLLENIKFGLKKGKWFNKNNMSSDIIPIVISSKMESKYKLNQKYQINLIGDKNKIIKMNVKVIGILEKPNLILWKSRNDNLFDYPADIKLYSNFNGIIMPYKPSVQGEVLIHYHNDSNGSIVYLPNKNNSDILEINKELDEFGRFYKMENDLMEYKKNGFLKIFTPFLVVGIIAIILSIVSITGYNTLLLIDMEKEYGIYFLNGCSWKKCIIISSLPNLFLILISTVISSVVFRYFSFSIYGRYFTRPDLIAYYGIQLIILFFIITSIDPYIRMKKKNPIEFLRKSDTI